MLLVHQLVSSVYITSAAYNDWYRTLYIVNTEWWSVFKHHFKGSGKKGLPMSYNNCNLPHRQTVKKLHTAPLKIVPSACALHWSWTHLALEGQNYDKNLLDSGHDDVHLRLAHTALLNIPGLLISMHNHHDSIKLSIYQEIWSVAGLFLFFQCALMFKASG